ncbi:MAG TPA: choice-of-anchor Q domain-containing protein, partial [Parasegetibacter sp.]
PSTNSVPKLTLQECIIENIFDAGILSINSSVYARNSLILNCGNNFVAVYGGNYQFDHCTVASFSTSYLSHKNPVLIVNDFVVDGSVSFTAPLDAVFNNCIFWGDDGMVKDEIIVLKEGNDHSVRFNHCLYKTETDLPHAVFVNSIKNQNPLFEKIDINKREFNLRLQPGSPAINAGANLGISFDLDNLPRNLASPDIGCYESQ